MGDVVNITLAVFTSLDIFQVDSLGWVNLGTRVNMYTPLRWGSGSMTPGPGKSVSATALPQLLQQTGAHNYNARSITFSIAAFLSKSSSCNFFHTTEHRR